MLYFDISERQATPCVMHLSEVILPLELNSTSKLWPLPEASDFSLLSYKYGYFSYKKPLLHFRRHLLTTWSRMDYFVMMDG